MYRQPKQLVVLVTFIGYLFINLKLATATCAFSVNTDMAKMSPMFISSLNGTTVLIPRDRDGNVIMNHGEQVYLTCPGITNNVEGFGSKMVTAVCNTMKSFYINGERMARLISSIKCRQHPASYSVERHQTCAGNQGELYEIGFEINSIRKPLIKVCFDNQNKKTFWAASVINRSSSFHCTVDGVHFKKNYFGNIDPDDRYSISNQQRRIPSDYSVDSNSIERGHLVPKCDFLDAASKRMTYYYINAAPQWKSFNGGNWKYLENKVRDKATSLNKDLLVYTGTHGILVLNNQYITLDSSGKMPVPLFFWKVVIQEELRQGIAFVGVNHPFQRHIPICPDICAQINWLGNFATQRNVYQNGQVYCCRIDDLKMIPNIALPQFPTYRGILV